MVLIQTSMQPISTMSYTKGNRFSNSSPQFETSEMTKVIRNVHMKDEDYQRIQFDAIGNQQAINAYQMVQNQAKREAFLSLVGVNIFV